MTKLQNVYSKLEGRADFQNAILTITGYCVLIASKTCKGCP